jgi:hypothetical protein
MLVTTFSGFSALSADQFTSFSQTLTLQPDTLRARGITSTQAALDVLKNLQGNLTAPTLLFRESKADISGYDLIVDNCATTRSSFGFGLIDDARVATIPCGTFEVVDAAAIAVGGSGFVNTNIASDQSADLIKRLGNRLTLTEFQNARKLGTVAQVRQKVNSLIQLGEQKRAAEKARKDPDPSDPSEGLVAVRKTFPLGAKIAIGVGVVGVIGVIALVAARR